MSARHLQLPLVALAAAAVLAGCGSSSPSSSTTATKATTSSAPAASSPELKKAVAECHHLIQSEKSLPATAKTKLEDACDKVGEGQTTAVKQAAREVCEEVVAKSGLPESSPARKQAQAACQKG